MYIGLSIKMYSGKMREILILNESFAMSTCYSQNVRTKKMLKMTFTANPDNDWQSTNRETASSQKSKNVLSCKLILTMNGMSMVKFMKNPTNRRKVSVDQSVRIKHIAFPKKFTLTLTPLHCLMRLSRIR